MICLSYQDIVQIGFITVNRYGTESITELIDIPAIVDLSTGYAHTDNQTAVVSDAIVYVDPESQAVIDNYYRLEEAVVVITLFDTPESDAWYKVTDVNVSRDTQLCNKIDNIQLTLKKTVEVGYVS